MNVLNVFIRTDRLRGRLDLFNGIQGNIDFKADRLPMQGLFTTMFEFLTDICIHYPSHSIIACHHVI